MYNFYQGGLLVLDSNHILIHCVIYPFKRHDIKEIYFKYNFISANVLTHFMKSYKHNLTSTICISLLLVCKHIFLQDTHKSVENFKQIMTTQNYNSKDKIHQTIKVSQRRKLLILGQWITKLTQQSHCVDGTLVIKISSKISLWNFKSWLCCNTFLGLTTEAQHSHQQSYIEFL